MIPKSSRRITPGNILALVASIYLAVVLFQVIKHNYQLSRQVSALQSQIQQLQDQKDQLSYQVQYYRTDSFKEKEARANLGLQAPGEGVIVLPRRPQAQTQANSKPQPAKSNWEQWKDFLFG